MFIGYLLYLENRITLCNTSFILLTEYQLPVPNGCIVVPIRTNFENSYCVSQSYCIFEVVFVSKHASLQYGYCCTTYDEMAFLLEGTTGNPSVYPETLDPAILKIL